MSAKHKDNFESLYYSSTSLAANQKASPTAFQQPPQIAYVAPAHYNQQMAVTIQRSPNNLNYHQPQIAGSMHTLHDPYQPQTPLEYGQSLKADTYGNTASRQPSEETVGSTKQLIAEPGTEWTKDRYSRKRHCCCFRTQQGMWLFNIFLVIFLAALAVVGYFFFPRFTQMKLIEIVPQGTGSLLPGPQGGLAVSLSMAMTVAVWNPNLYDLKVTNIDIQAFLLPNVTQLSGQIVSTTAGPIQIAQGTSVLVGNGGTNDTNILGSKQNVTLHMPFNLNYNTNADLTKDPALAEILQACGFLNTKPRDMQIHYKAVAVTEGIDKLGYKPVFENDFHVHCPPSIQDSLKNILPSLSSILNNVSPANAVPPQ